MIRLLWAALVVVLACSPASAQVTLARKYVEGSKSVSNTEVKSHQILTIDKTDVETRSKQFIVLASTVGKRMPDETLPIESKIETLQSELSLPGGINVKFDSGSPDKKADIPQLEQLMDVFRIAAKANWITVLDKMNQVKAVESKEKIPEGIDEKFKSQFDPETRKRAIVQALANLPDKPVSKGDTWVRTSDSDLGAGQKLTLKTQYEYLGPVEKDGKMIDEVGIKTTEATYVMDPNSPSPLKVTSSELKVTESKGRLLFDREKGAVVENTTSFRIQGDLKLSVNGKEVPGKLDLTIESTMKLQP